MVLCENDIQHGAGDNPKLEANLFVKVANKAKGVRAETEVIVLSAEQIEDVQEETTVKRYA